MRTQLLHYSDFFFREMDWWIGTMLYLCLLLLTLLPISYLHSKMLFNSAFADTLSQVNKANSLTLTTHPHHSSLTTHHSTFTLTLALTLTRFPRSTTAASSWVSSTRSSPSAPRLSTSSLYLASSA